MKKIFFLLSFAAFLTPSVLTAQTPTKINIARQPVLSIPSAIIVGGQISVIVDSFNAQGIAIKKVARLINTTDFGVKADVVSNEVVSVAYNVASTGNTALTGKIVKMTVSGVVSYCIVDKQGNRIDFAKDVDLSAINARIDSTNTVNNAQTVAIFGKASTVQLNALETRVDTAKVNIRAESANNINYEQSERMRQDSILNANKLSKSDTSKYVRYGANANGKTLTLGNYVNGYGYKMDMTNGNIAANQNGNNALFQSNLNSLDVANYAASGSNSYRVSISASNPETGNMFPTLKLKYNNETALVAHVTDSSKVFVYDEIAQSPKYGNALFSYQGDWYEQKLDGTKKKIIQEQKVIKDEIAFDILPDVIGFTDYAIAIPYILKEDTYIINASFPGGAYSIESPNINSAGSIVFRLRRHTDTSGEAAATYNMKITVFRD